LDCKQVPGIKILKVYFKLFQFEEIHLCIYEKRTFMQIFCQLLWTVNVVSCCSGFVRRKFQDCHYSYS
jgi:hypothetical protein